MSEAVKRPSSNIQGPRHFQRPTSKPTPNSQLPTPNANAQRPTPRRPTPRRPTPNSQGQVKGLGAWELEVRWSFGRWRLVVVGTQKWYLNPIIIWRAPTFVPVIWPKDV